MPISHLKCCMINKKLFHRLKMMISELQRKWEATPAHRQRADLIISIPVKHAVYIRSVVPISPTFKLWRSPGCEVMCLMGGSKDSINTTFKIVMDSLIGRLSNDNNANISNIECVDLIIPSGMEMDRMLRRGGPIKDAMATTGAVIEYGGDKDFK